MASVAVVGGGVGGMSAALRLRAAGHEVTVFERMSTLGGKLAQRQIEGFSFDIGPSLLTWPEVFEELFAAAGSSWRDEVDSVRLPQPFTYRYANGSSFSVSDEVNLTAASIARMAGGQSVREWSEFMERARKGWEVAERTFFAGPLESPRRLLTRMQSPSDFLAIDPFVTLARRSKKAFEDVRLQMWLNRYATYSGSDPWKTPATAACIPYLEQQRGAWHVTGGLARLSNVLTSLMVRRGVRVETNAEVSAIHTSASRITGLTVNGEPVGADAVVVNADAEHLYSDLLPRRSSLQRARRAGRSTSGFAMLLGLRGQTEGLAHHNVWFTSDQRREFAQMNKSGVADNPTIYVCCSSVTDPTQAPAGDENWFVLINVAAGVRVDWTAYGNHIVERLGVSERVVVKDQLTPQDYESLYRAPGGAIYGSSSNSRSAAFLRSANRGPVKGLYLASGSSHPGGGLPLVALSGKFVASLVQEDFA